MGELNNIFKKLNIMEQSQLNKYINQKVNNAVNSANMQIDEAKKLLEEEENKIKQYYVDTNNKTWQRIETSIHVALRENRVSEERINRIDKRVLELNQKQDLLLGEEIKSEYKILADADFQKLFELLAYKYCNSCTSRNNKCEVYPLLKKYGIPTINEGFKCKYAYKRKLKMSSEKENK